MSDPAIIVDNGERQAIEYSGQPWKRREVIGDAVLYLGDAREIVPTIDPVPVIATDPPYGMSFRSNRPKVRPKAHAIANDDNEDALRWVCDLPVSHSKYVFCRWDNIASVPRPKSLITWVKNNHSMGDLTGEHARQTEVALFYPGPAHFFPGQRPADVIRAPRTDNADHPTQKPVALMGEVLRWTSGAVLDPFMGSGSTGVACVQLGRHFVGIEIDPVYFQTACKRIAEAYRQPRLFEEPAPKPVQTDIFGGAA